MSGALLPQTAAGDIRVSQILPPLIPVALKEFRRWAYFKPNLRLASLTLGRGTPIPGQFPQIGGPQYEPQNTMVLILGTA